MLNENRISNIKKHESYRRTLLCYSTLCLFSYLIIFYFFIEIFIKRSFNSFENSNKTISLNLFKYRSSLIECGQSVVEKENLYKIIEDFIKINKENFSLNKKLNENMFLKTEISIWLDFILNKCFKARQFSLIEQQKPNFIRKFISILRKEFLYIAGFFIKDI